MDSRSLFLLIAALGCPIGMSLMMWFMMRQDGHQHMSMDTMPKEVPPEQLAALRAQKDTLERHIHELEAVQALEERREHLEREIAARREETQVQV